MVKFLQKKKKYIFSREFHNSFTNVYLYIYLFNMNICLKTNVRAK